MAGGVNTQKVLKPDAVNNVDENLQKSDFETLRNKGEAITFDQVINKSLTDRLASKVAETSSGSSTAFQSDVLKKADSSYLIKNSIDQNTLNRIQTKPNILNTFSNYTYHVTFSMIEQDYAYKIDANSNLSNYKRIIIAETGATSAFNITSFNINNTVSPNFKNQNQNLMEWSMTITEPFGLAFPDYLIVAAEATGVSNVSRFPFFIELWFTGYDNDGNIVLPNVSRRIWRVIMLNFDVQNDQTGTVYNLRGIMDNDIGSSNQYAMTQATLNLNGVTKFGEAIQKLKEALNTSAQKAESSDAPTIYDVQLPSSPNISEWSIIPPNPEDDDGRGDDLSGNGKDITLNRGIDIGSFITNLLAKCGPQAEAFLKGQVGSGGSGSFDKHGLGNIMQVYTTVEYLKYKDNQNDYQRKITFHLVPYTTSRVVLTPEMANKVTNEQVQRDRLKYLINNNSLAKRYEWIYTGKNTEVLKFDMKIDNFWAVAMPSFLGGSTYGQVTQGLIVNAQSQYVREAYKQADQFKTSVIAAAKAIAPDASLSGISPYAFAKSVQSQMSGLQNTISQASGLLATAQSTVQNVTNMASTIRNLTSGSTGGVAGILNTVNGVVGIANSAGSITNALRSIGTIQSLSAGPLALFNTGVKSTVQNLANTVQNYTATASNFLTPDQSVVSLASSSTANAQNRKNIYLEDIQTAINSGDPNRTKAVLAAFMTSNEPTAQSTVTLGAERKNIINNNDLNAGGLGSGQSLFAATVKNIYANSFMIQIELEIRGDPWWIGMTNLEESAYVKSKMQNQIPTTIPYSTVNYTTNKSQAVANFLMGENMFLLTFRNGINYDEATGMMKLDVNNDYFNGMYFVLQVENRFENGNFTQVLKAVKEIFSQVAGNEAAKTEEVNREGKGDLPQVPTASTDYRTTTDSPLVTQGGTDFGLF